MERFNYLANPTTLLLPNHPATASPPSLLLPQLVRLRSPSSGRSVPDEVAATELAAFLLAGHESLAQSLTWTLYLLARHTGVQVGVATNPDGMTHGGAGRGGH